MVGSPIDPDTSLITFSRGIGGRADGAIRFGPVTPPKTEPHGEALDEGYLPNAVDY